MYCIDVFDNGININGQRLTFPLSYDEIKTVLGQARLYHYGTNGDYISYVYDELGISFDGSTYYLNNLKKKKAYKDKEHTIIGLTLYVSGKNIYESFLHTMVRFMKMTFS